MAESGRNIATIVRTWEPSSGALVTHCKIEKIADDGVSISF